jgi:hypothetical protein
MSTQSLEQALGKHQTLVDEGRWREAIDYLTAINRESPDFVIEQSLANLRLEAYESMELDPAGDFPPQWTDTFDPSRFEGGIPVIDAGELDVNTLACGVIKYGSVIVRGLVDSGEAADLAAGIDEVMAAQARKDNKPNGVPAWCAPPDGLKKHKLGVGRKFIADTGGVWAIDSPHMVFLLFDLFDRLGLRELITEYFGESPAVSVRKWVLRRVSPLPAEPDWHQDGSFMGTDLHSVNLWVALNECGGDTNTPGIDLIPKRFEEIVRMGSDGACFEWTVGPGYVTKTFADTPQVRPHFMPGDAVFFDHFNLHRTSFSPSMDSDRYAIECWFFAPSTYPMQQIPLVF